MSGRLAALSALEVHFIERHGEAEAFRITNDIVAFTQAYRANKSGTCTAAEALAEQLYTFQAAPGSTWDEITEDGRRFWLRFAEFAMLEVGRLSGWPIEHAIVDIEATQAHNLRLERGARAICRRRQEPESSWPKYVPEVADIVAVLDTMKEPDRG